MAFTGMKVGVVVMVVLAMTAAVAVATPAEYAVTWDFPAADRYYSTQARTYKVGDKLTFLYTQGMHNVVKVGSEKDFAACTTHTAQVLGVADGHTSVTLNEAGPHYFICSFDGHCGAGMKIKVQVHA